MIAGKPLDEIVKEFPDGPERIVSLVPSYTGSLIDLGFGDRLVGVTDYCIPGKDVLQHVTRVGGVWDAWLDGILQLKPDLVIANQEENKPDLVNAMEQAGLNVWLTFPHSLMEMFEVLAGMVRLYHSEAAAFKVRMLESSLDWAIQSASDSRRIPYFCPIWQERTVDGEMWWMTFNRQTYAGDLLDAIGGENIFGTRVRRYPLLADLDKAPPEDAGSRDVRYPRVTLAEILAGQPEVILVPDEPFPYGESICNELIEMMRDTPAARAGRIYRIDGRLIAWYGTHLGAALEELPQYFLI
jgi:iron complex transport system substrate-binding protein